MRVLFPILLVFIAGVLYASDIGPALQSSSVNIKSMSNGGGAQGSGTIFLLPTTGDNQQAWVLTAHHVIKNQRRVETVIDGSGRERKRVVYDDVQIVQERTTTDGARIVGDKRMDARIISIDAVRDIALLLVRAQDEFKNGGHMYLDAKVCPAGTSVYHCGAPGGQDLGGSATLTGGIISRTGVRIRQFGGSQEGIYDQVDCSGLGGSSGGMVCLAKDGAWIGMITLGLQGSSSFHWIVPVRNVRGWAKQVGVEWLFDPNAKPLTEDQIKQIPLEVGSTIFGDKGKDEEPKAATVIHRIQTVEPRQIQQVPK